eukprot:536456_1
MAFSCDTFVCMKEATEEGFTTLCKNSDRHPNETHEVVIVPEIKIDDSTIIECTYTKVSPPKSYSHRCLLCKPVWMWGAEMGSNDQGVCIGNEAAYPNSYAKNDIDNDNYSYLTGMDLLRLALMFGDNAFDCVKIIDFYLQNYTQNGNTSWMGKNAMYYSTYLIADYNETWIVETINQYFVAKKHIDGIHSISNRYNLIAPFDMISNSLINYCTENNINWQNDLNIQKQFGEWKKTYISNSYNRQCFIQNTLQNILTERKLKMNDFTDILRSHKVRNTQINNGIFGMDICAHGSYGPIRCVNTTGSFICILRRDGTITNFVTGTSAPCISIFKPIYIECNIGKEFGVGFRKYCNGNIMMNTQTFDGLLKKKNDIISTANMLIYNDNIMKYKNQLWWKHEIFHRLYLKYFINDKEFNKKIKNEINEFEKDMFKQLIEDYHEYNSIYENDNKIVEKQQKTMDKYWNKSYCMLDEMLKEAQVQNQIKIVSKNKENNYKIFSIVFNVFNCYSLLTKYLHETQWIYWNKLAGICISKNGIVNQTQCKTNNTNNSRNNIFLSFFNGNSIFRWIKLMLASVWSVLLIAIGWKLLS